MTIPMTTMLLRQEGQLRVLVAGGWAGGDLASAEVYIDDKLDIFTAVLFRIEIMVTF